MPTPGSIDDLARAARRRLPRVAFDFIEGGADGELTLRANLEAFQRRTLVPRWLVDVGSRDTSTTLFGDVFALPLLIAPTGMARVAGPGGDVAGARAAGSAGAGFVLSTMSSHSIEEVAAEASGHLWFQLYLWRQRDVVERLVGRAAAASYRALMVTIDVPVVGNRLRDVRNGFVFPPRLRRRTAWDMLRHPRWLAGMPSAMTFANIREPSGGAKAMEHMRLMRSLLENPSADWDDLRWLRELWNGPLLVKGVLCPEDARLAVECGANGIVVSNHGGRQLDGTMASLDALEAVVAAVPDTVTVLLDGGVRRGTDILKALALGARACLIGRPWLYGLAVGGEDGVALTIEILRREFDRALALTGRTSAAAVDRSVLAAA